MTALLSIKPEFAKAIFDGTKLYEFRRCIFKREVSRVVVYVTSPVCKVLGEFSVEGIIHEEVDQLWDTTKSHAGIERDFFFAYFTEKTKGYAIKIGNPRLYDEPHSLREKYGKYPPQSFLYLSES